MPLAPWRSPLSRALHRNRSLVYARYLQLATVRSNHRPANRTVVFRGFFDDETNQLKFVVDGRSEKTEQIEQNPWAEGCWYFPKTREQFRLLGMLTLIGESHPDPTLAKARQIAWQDLSDSARAQYLWPHPGQAKADAIAFSPPPPDATKPLPQFCLLLLSATQVDHLELRGDPQNRQRYLLADDRTWEMQDLNP
jgi:pyridoxamine 5'-phosphate oxidase